jgi:hypothetical protein
VVKKVYTAKSLRITPGCLFNGCLAGCDGMVYCILNRCKIAYNEGLEMTVYTMTLRVDGGRLVFELKDAWGQERVIEGALIK